MNHVTNDERNAYTNNANPMVSKAVSSVSRPVRDIQTIVTIVVKNVIPPFMNTATRPSKNGISDRSSKYVCESIKNHIDLLFCALRKNTLVSNGLNE